MRMLFIFLIAFVALISKVAAKDKFDCDREFFVCNSQCGLTHEKNDFVGIRDNCKQDCFKNLKNCVKSIERIACNKEYMSCDFKCKLTHRKDGFAGINNCDNDCVKKLKSCLKL